MKENNKISIKHNSTKHYITSKEKLSIIMIELEINYSKLSLEDVPSKSPTSRLPISILLNNQIAPGNSKIH